MFTTRTNSLTCLLHNLKKVEMKYTLQVPYKQSVFVFRKIILFKVRHGLIIRTAYFLILVILINGKQFSYELDACTDMMILKVNKLSILFTGENCGKNIRMTDSKYFTTTKKGKFGDHRATIFYQYTVHEMLSYTLNLLNAIVKFSHILNFYPNELHFHIIMNIDMYILTAVS